MGRIATMTACLACSIAPLAAAAPPQFFGGDTFMTARVDLTQLTFENIRKSVVALIDEPALRAAGTPISIQDDVMPQLQPMQMALGMLGMITGSGATSVDIVVATPQGAMAGEPNVFILMPTAGEQQAQSLMQFAGAMAMQAGMRASQVTSSGPGAQHWVVLHNPAHRLPTAGLADRARSFHEALEGIQGSNLVTWVVVPTDDMRRQAMEDLGADDEIGRAMAQSEWLGGWISLGDAPQIGMGAVMRDEDSARQLETAYVQGLSTLNQMAREQDQMLAEWGQAPDGPSLTDMSGMITRIASMERRGRSLRVVLTTPELREMTTMMIRSGDMFGEIMGELMEGGLGDMFGF